MVARFGNRQDEESIRTSILETLKGFNSHDAKLTAQAYMADSDLVTSRGDLLKGRAEIERRVAGLFATSGKNAAQRLLDVSIRFIRDDVALAHVSVELSGLASPTGETLPSHRELNLRVYVKDSGSWQVSAFHNTLVTAPATTKPL
jgi:uncharacterized protein (TIGR02246 family)